MPLDTRSKRASSVGIGLLFLLAPPLPDATIAQGDRQHIAISYSGILAEEANIVDAVSEVTIVAMADVSTIVATPDYEVRA
jgi:hypothetical protein